VLTFSGACFPLESVLVRCGRVNERFYTTTQILPCYTQRTPPKRPIRLSLLPSLPTTSRSTLACLSTCSPPPRSLSLASTTAALPPPSAHPSNTTTAARQPSPPPHIHPLKLLPTHSQPATLLALIPHRHTRHPHGSGSQPTPLQAFCIIDPTPHRRTPRSCPPASTQQPDILVRPRPSAALVPPTPSPHSPCCVAHGHAALTSASRLLALPSCTPGAIGKAIARLTRGSAAGERSVWTFEYPLPVDICLLELPLLPLRAGHAVIFSLERPQLRDCVLSFLGLASLAIPLRCITASETFVQGLLSL